MHDESHDGACWPYRHGWKLVAVLMLTVVAAQTWTSHVTPGAAGGKQPRASFDLLLKKKTFLEGALVLEKHKMLVCVPTKTASSVTSLIVLALAGNLERVECTCNPGRCVQNEKERTIMNRRRRSFLFNKHVAGVPHRSPTTGKIISSSFVRHAWQGIVRGPRVRNPLLWSSVMDRSFTSVLLVRDPWERAISMYKDQVRRSVVEGFKADSRDDFLRFMTARLGQEHHTRAASDFCGTEYVKYDVIIDVDTDWEAGWQRALKRASIDPAVLKTGWESCTEHGSPSVLADVGNVRTLDRSVAAKLSCADVASNQAEAPLRPTLVAGGGGRRGGCNDSLAHGSIGVQRDLASRDRIFCNESVALAVAERYARDYAAFAFQGVRYEQPYRCGGPTPPPPAHARLNGQMFRSPLMMTSIIKRVTDFIFHSRS